MIRKLRPCSSQAARSSRSKVRRTLPESSRRPMLTTSKLSGCLYRLSRSLRKSHMPSATDCASAASSSSTMACTRWPYSESGRPTTMQERTFGCALTAASTSAGIDVGAAAQDHVGEPVAKIEIAIGVEPADVTERFPAVGTALRLGAEIVIGAAGAVVGQEINLAGFARRGVVAVLADDAQAAGFADLADRTLVREPFDAGNDGSALPLGAAIEFVDPLRTKPFDPFFFQPGRHRRGHVKHDVETGEVVGVPHLVRQRPDPM